jgi:hypothetical protein
MRAVTRGAIGTVEIMIFQIPARLSLAFGLLLASGVVAGVQSAGENSK